MTDAFKVPLITRPRRWGKSSNMNMLKTFLEIEVDEHGNELPEEQKRNPVYFKGGEICVDNKKILHQELQIVKSKIIIQKKEYDIIDYLGKYPVILMSFKDLGGESYEKIVAGFKIKLRKTFDQHKYLLASPQLTEIEKARYSKYLATEVTEKEVEDSISYLMECLYKHFGKKAWVLIDEYDNAIHRAYTEFGQDAKNPRQFSKEFKRVLDLFRDLMSAAFKGNDYLERGLITGILRIAQANLFSGLSNVKEYGVLSKRFASYYGFEQHEVDALCEKYQIPEHKQKQLAAWYNGYSYGGLKLYNPWSIMNCMTDGDGYLKNYWEATSYGALQNLTITEDLQQELQDLLSKNINSTQLYLGSGFNLNVLSDGDTNGMKVLLLLAGYLNPLQIEDCDYPILYEVNIPNQEVRIALADLIQMWIANKLGIGIDKLKTIAAYLMQGNVYQFQLTLHRFLQSTLSFRIMHE